jgi:hypothetical protein
MAVSMLDPRFMPDPLAGTRPVQPNWNLAQIPGMAAQWFAPPPPDIAAANRAATTADAEAAAAAKAAAGGIQNQQDEEVVDAMASRYKLAPEDERIQRQFKTADSIRNYGRSLNTGSVNGAAPNWAGALADIAGGYLSSKERKAAEAAAAALGERYADIGAKNYRGVADAYFR